MSEQKAQYLEEAYSMLRAGYEPAAEIEKPRTVSHLTKGGIKNVMVWGWVKMSAQFIAHIKVLRGAKLAIWQTIALSIDESGKCKLTLTEISEITGYSRTEVIDSLKELSELGYLGTSKSPKGNIYTPAFVARGVKTPSQETVPAQGTESTPLDQSESSPSIGESPSSIKELKELKSATALSPLEVEKIQQSADKAFDAFLVFEGQAQAAKADGKAWRGRELLPPTLIEYGDWWHSRTGLHMYGAKGKPKMDATWLDAFRKWHDNELTVAHLDAGLAALDWMKQRGGGVTHPRQVTAEALRAQADELNNVAQSGNEKFIGGSAYV